MATTKLSKESKGPQISQDVLIDIFKFLISPKDFAACESVSKSWREAGLNRSLWQFRIQKLFEGKLLSPTLRRMPKNSKATYVFALTDAKRTSFDSREELTEKLW